MEAVVSTENLPVGMEYFPAGNESQFDYIKKLIDNCDYYILVLAGKYGSINEKTGLSYTEMEYDYAVEKGVPVAALLFKELGNLPGKKLEETDKLKASLKAFRDKCLKDKMCSFWENKDQLVSKTKDAINNLIKSSPRPGWVRYSEIISEMEKKASTPAYDLLMTEPLHYEEQDDFTEGSIHKQAVTWKDIVLIVAPELNKNSTTGQIDDALRSALGQITQDDCDSIRMKLVSYGIATTSSVTDEYSGPYTSMAFTSDGYAAWTKAKNLETEGLCFHQDTRSLIDLFNNISTDVLDDFMREGPASVSGSFLTVSFNWKYCTSAASFSIHDSQLFELIKAFSKSIQEMSSHGECYEPVNGDRYRFVTRYHNDVYTRLLSLWDEMRSQYFNMISYIKERYPGVRFTETNAEYQRNFR